MWYEERNVAPLLSTIHLFVFMFLWELFCKTKQTKQKTFIRQNKKNNCDGCVTLIPHMQTVIRGKKKRKKRNKQQNSYSDLEVFIITRFNRPLKGHDGLPLIFPHREESVALLCIL